jgi:hypothetical protein
LPCCSHFLCGQTLSSVQNITPIPLEAALSALFLLSDLTAHQSPCRVAETGAQPLPASDSGGLRMHLLRVPGNVNTACLGTQL